MERRLGDSHPVVERLRLELEALASIWPDDGNRLRFELKELETAGDRIITHDVIHHLNVKGATPFSVSDAHELISELDYVIDLAEEMADFTGSSGTRSARSSIAASTRWS